MSWQEYVKQAKVSEEKFAKNLIDPVINILLFIEFSLVALSLEELII